MLVDLQHELVSRVWPIEQHMVCVNEAAADGDFDAHAEDVAVVDGVRVWIIHFVGCDAGAGAVDVLDIALLLGRDEF